ncbi:hypothetical protein TWF281_011383 [Arthrobotrys megalospora]
MDHKSNSWALLIAVEAYIPGTKRPGVTYSKLNGCVRDVRAMERYLRKLGVENIKTLTASGDNGPVEPRTELPIYENIEREFQHIINAASPGDLVYIHYSGHGIRRQVLDFRQDKKDKKNEKNEKYGDTITGTALALADVMNGGAYLTGYQLGVFMKRMVKEEKLRVTLVLDSCFSGQGVRSSDYSLRTAGIPFDNSILESDIAAEAAAAADVGTTSGTGGRGAHVKHSWLSNPSGCTVLTACQFDEAAGESKFPDTDGVHGVLTYWMLKILEENTSMRPSYSRIKEYVRSNIVGMIPKLDQSPVLHGDGDYVFLGKEVVIERPLCRVLSQCEESDANGQVFIELDIGRAQGVEVGAIYNIYPTNAAIGAGASATPLEAYIIEVSEDSLFQSTAQFLTNSKRPTPANKEYSAAVLRTWALPDTYVSISLPDIRSCEADNLVAEIEQTPGLCPQINKTTNETTFAVAIDQCNKFEILTDGKQLPRVPKLSSKDEKWIQKLSYLLSHLARFRALEAIPKGIPNQLLSSNCFSFTVTTRGPLPRPIRYYDGRYHAPGGQELIISFKLTENYPYESCYVSFYGFSSSWGIQKLYPGPGQTARKTHKLGKERFKVVMEAPHEGTEGDSFDIEDTIRAYISTKETSWEEHSLPDLPIEASSIPIELPKNIPATPPSMNTNTRAFEDFGPVEEDMEKLGIVDLIIRTSKKRGSVKN